MTINHLRKRGWAGEPREDAEHRRLQEMEDQEARRKAEQVRQARNKAEYSLIIIDSEWPDELRDLMPASPPKSAANIRIMAEVVGDDAPDDLRAAITQAERTWSAYEELWDA